MTEERRTGTESLWAGLSRTRLQVDEDTDVSANPIPGLGTYYIRREPGHIVVGADDDRDFFVPSAARRSRGMRPGTLSMNVDRNSDAVYGKLVAI